MRYERQIALKQIGSNGQEKISKASVSIVGAGALGSMAAELLARAGVGELKIFDRDIVEITNLQRQSLYSEEDLGKPKAQAAVQRLRKINSEIKLQGLSIDVDYQNIEQIKADLILDCTDNLEIRFLIDDYCRKNKIKWIHSAAVADMGLVYVVEPKSVRLRQFMKEAQGLETCETSGVLNSIIAITAAIQVDEALKVLTGRKPEEKLIRFNLADASISKIATRKLYDIKGYEYLEGKLANKTTKLCGSNIYQIKAAKVNLDLLKGKHMGICVSADGITIFDDGRALVHANSESQARKKYSRFIGS